MQDVIREMYSFIASMLGRIFEGNAGWGGFSNIYPRKDSLRSGH